MNILQEYRPKVEDELRLIVQKGSTPLLDLNTMYSYHMGLCDRDGKTLSSTKGKYLRPLFCIAMCAGLGGDPEQAIPAAAALELAHRTTLIFDDIQDEGQERNNQPTVWSIWGTDQAINAGLILSSYARLALHRLTLRNVPAAKVLRISSVLENAVIDLCHGQYMDISFVDAPTVSVRDYLRMVRGKTGALFGASCSVGAILATPCLKEFPVFGPIMRNALEFGLNMGVAFQIHDDYLGIWGDEATVGKTANDIQEKKRSLPVVLALELFPDKLVTSNRTMRNWLNCEFIMEKDAADIRAWLESVGIPEKVKRVERSYIRKARSNLGSLAIQPEWLTLFEEMLAFLSERKL